ncbi:MAG: D-2-hydroxyacid dehydrogenase [Lachnospiraceae bacterium]|nr:D-2-hydroxyacid dehydrogenase [Lachnospiraceae bacterium]
MKIVFLDRNTIGFDIETAGFRDFGELEEHDSCSVSDSKKYIKDADVVIFNKTVMNEDMLKDASNVKLLCVTATGYDNVDLDYCRSRGIAVCNVRGYSTPAVVQHTFALALYVLEKISYYDNYVKSGEYCKASGFSNFDERYFELEGKTWGIVGMGNIGRGVAKVASAFGCRVIYYSASGNNCSDLYERVDFDTLLHESDILSLHCPLNEKTRGLMNIEAFKQMKKSAILVNVARGPVVDEQALYTALTQNMIAGAGLDVLSKEPMSVDNPLINIKDSKKLIITPHMAWASIEARSRCVQEIYKNIESFLAGEERNRVDI